MKKYLTLIASFVLVAALAVGGTLAYLMDSKSVTNTFTVGNIEMTMDEAKVNEYGQKLDNQDAVYENDTQTLAARVASNEYKLIPGHEYVKDPIIHVLVKSEPCYVFIKIENGIAEIEDTIEGQLTAWTQVTDAQNVYYYNDIVDARTAQQDVATFATFKVNSDADVSRYGGETIVVTGYAVQSDGFANANAAWAATYGTPADSGEPETP